MRVADIILCLAVALLVAEVVHIFAFAPAAPSTTEVEIFLTRN
jgi:hypothetical protein